MTVSEGAAAVVTRPKLALLVQIDLYVAEIVLLDEGLQQREYLIVVEFVDCLYLTLAVVYFPV